MSEEKKDQSASSAPSSGGQSTAESYIDEQLVQARKGLKTIRIVMTCLSLFVLGYMSILASKIGEFTEPETAAETAMGLVQPQITDFKDQMLDQVKTQIPELLQDLPDQAVAKIPEFRKELQEKIITSMRTYATDSSIELGEQLDAHLEAHSDSIGEFLETVDDPVALEEFAKEITKDIDQYLDDRSSGESIREKVRLAHEALRGIENHVAFLANSKKLTPHQKNQREVIGILVRTVEMELSRMPAHQNLFGL